MQRRVRVARVFRRFGRRIDLGGRVENGKNVIVRDGLARHPGKRLAFRTSRRLARRVRHVPVSLGAFDRNCHGNDSQTKASIGPQCADNRHRHLDARRSAERGQKGLRRTVPGRFPPYYSVYHVGAANQWPAFVQKRGANSSDRHLPADRESDRRDYWSATSPRRLRVAVHRRRSQFPKFTAKIGLSPLAAKRTKIKQGAGGYPCPSGKRG